MLLLFEILNICSEARDILFDVKMQRKKKTTTKSSFARGTFEWYGVLGIQSGK